MPSESSMTRAARFSGVILLLFLVCQAAAILLWPRLPRDIAYRVRHWRSQKIQSVLANDRATSLPNVTFWAWERPEDLRFLRPDQASVAFLAKTIFLEAPPSNASANSSPSFTI